MSDKHLLAGGFGFPLGFVAATVVVLVSAAATNPLVALVALACVTAAVAAVTTLPAALGTALVSWGLYAGFVTGHLGQLQLTGRTALAAGVLLLAALAAFGAVALRHRRTAPPVRR
jgi:hypothetical protein